MQTQTLGCSFPFRMDAILDLVSQPQTTAIITTSTTYPAVHHTEYHATAGSASRLSSLNADQRNHAKQPRPNQLPSPAISLPLRHLPNQEHRCLALPLLHPGYLAVYAVLDAHLLRGHSSRGSAVRAGDGMSELEDGVDRPGDIWCDWGYRGADIGEYCRFDVSC